MDRTYNDGVAHGLKIGIEKGYKKGYIAGLEEAKKAYESLHSSDPKLDRRAYVLGYMDALDPKTKIGVELLGESNA